MLNDALKLTIDSVFLPKKGQLNFEKSDINVFDVPGYDINMNMWSQLTQFQSQQIVQLPTHLPGSQSNNLASKGNKAEGGNEPQLIDVTHQEIKDDISAEATSRQ